MPAWDTILNFIETLGWFKGMMSIIIIVLIGWIFDMYRGRLKDRQEEINRLATENRAYREKFLELMDTHFRLNNDND